MQVTLIDKMGTDLTVVNAARVSFAKEHDRMLLADEQLIQYLARHNHWSPFAHAQLSFRVKAPIFVARQLGKHQVGLAWNEVSRRYVDDEPEFFEPKVWRNRAISAKQGSGDEAVEVGLVPTLALAYAIKAYNELLGRGVCPELARMVLPQSMMTEWIWTGSLYAFARVCNLRLDTHAQAETREIAADIADIAAQAFPISWEALTREVTP